MRAKVVGAVVAFVVLLTFLNHTLVAGQSTWIDQTSATQYADNLISSYNADVKFYQALQSNFTTNQQYFHLYHGDGDNFEVIVVKGALAANHLNDSNVATFVFLPIHSANPEVVIDNSHTAVELLNLTGKASAGMTLVVGGIPSYTLAYGTVYLQIYINTNVLASYAPIAWATATAKVVSDTSVNSKSAAEAIYQNDVALALSPDHITPQAGVRSQNPISAILGNVWSYVVTGGGIALAVVVMYFGGVREFVKAVGSRKERKKVLKEMESVFRHNVNKEQREKEKKRKKEN